MKRLFFILLTFLPLLGTYALDIPDTPVFEEGPYARYELADSCYMEVMRYADSIVVVHTMCAPVCSSCAHVYNKEFALLHEITPTCKGFLPYATFREGQLVWQDHTIYLMDDEEKKRLEEE